MTLQQRTVLLVDDDQDQLDMLSLVLGGKDYKVLTASSVQQALSILTACQIDILISDHQLGDGNGDDIIRALQDKEYPLVRILITGQNFDEVGVKGTYPGFDAYLVKPCDIDTMRAVLRTSLRQKQKLSA